LKYLPQYSTFPGRQHLEVFRNVIFVNQWLFIHPHDLPKTFNQKLTTMQNTSNAAPQSTTQSNGKSGGMKSSQLMQLFEDELKDIYWAEKALVKAIPKMAKQATSEDLVAALEHHLEETKGQVDRLEQVFESIGKKASAKTCEAMKGLLEEGEGIMDECEAGPMRDAGIISAGQKIEHYEIASYGTLRQFAQTLGLKEAVGLLEQTLEQEKAADQKLTSVAVLAVNIQAASEKA